MKRILHLGCNKRYRVSGIRHPKPAIPLQKIELQPGRRLKKLPPAPRTRGHGTCGSGNAYFISERGREAQMEILVLGFVALALVITIGVIALKLLWLGAKLFCGLLLLPFKLLGGLIGVVLGIVFLPLVIVILVGAVFAGLALLPLIVPLVLIGLGIMLFATAC